MMVSAPQNKNTSFWAKEGEQLLRGEDTYMLRSLFRGKQEKGKNPLQKEPQDELYTELDRNIEQLHQLLDYPSDLTVRSFTIGQMDTTCAIVYIDGLIDRQIVQHTLIDNFESSMKDVPDVHEADLIETFYKELISINHIEKGTTIDDVATAILSGSVVLYVDGIATVLMIEAQGGETRAIEQPESERLVRGPRLSFVEQISTNLALVRRYIRDPNVRFKSHTIGRRSKQQLVIAYVDGIVNPAILQEVERRLKSIDVDHAPESGFIEQWIQDNYLSPFPQVTESERPDIVSSSLLQGKIAILLDGTPFVLIVPVVIGDLFKSPEDYYERWQYGTLLRLLRYLGAFLALFLPAIYVSLISFHQGLLPSKLAFSIAASREGVPFAPVIEAVMMVITLELLQEAGLRLPTPIGQTIGIVGGLVIGQASVQAGIVSPIMVIVVALTAIAAYATPTFSIGISFRILRFLFMIGAAMFGLYGVILVYIMMNIHMVNLKSFGIPYMTPYAPTILRDFKDLILRSPMTTLKKRPKYLQTEDDTKANKGEKES